MKSLKRHLRVMQRAILDRWHYPPKTFSLATTTSLLQTNSLCIKQTIRKNAGYENKLFNLKLATSKINDITIKPGQFFSFWKIIGNPDKGYKKSRAIIRGKLIEDSGGGLCQISGIIYHMSLMAGLEIIERHNHSVDIYTDETRFTPLGTDATVVYGYKDLRVRNILDTPVRFHFDISEDTLSLTLMSQRTIHERSITYTVHEKENEKLAILKDQNGTVLSRSAYKNL